MKGDDGDLPMLELDYMNSPTDPYTGMSFGASSRLWYGWENEVEAEPERAEKVIQKKGHSNEGRRLWGTILRQIDLPMFVDLTLTRNNSSHSNGSRYVQKPKPASEPERAGKNSNR